MFTNGLKTGALRGRLGLELLFRLAHFGYKKYFNQIAALLPLFPHPPPRGALTNGETPMK